MWEHILQPWWKGSALTSTHAGTHPKTMMERLSTPGWGFLVTNQMPSFSKRMETSFISDRVGTHSSITSELPSIHIWSCRNTSYSHIRMALSPRPSIPGTSPSSSIPRMAIALISDHVETNPIVTSEWLSTHIWHGRNQSSHHDRMAQPLHLAMEGT